MKAVGGQSVLAAGQVPAVEYANAKENILFAPFALEKPVEVGEVYHQLEWIISFQQ